MSAFDHWVWVILGIGEGKGWAPAPTKHHPFNHTKGVPKASPSQIQDPKLCYPAELNEVHTMYTWKHIVQQQTLSSEECFILFYDVFAKYSP